MSPRGVRVVLVGVLCSVLCFFLWRGVGCVSGLCGCVLVLGGVACRVVVREVCGSGVFLCCLLFLAVVG